MINVGYFNKLTINLSDDCLIKMSNHEKDYTLNNQDCANNGCFYFDGCNLSFIIDWNDVSIFTLGNYRNLLIEYNLSDDCNILSIDEDDCNDIIFEDILILDNVIILV